MKKLLRNIFKKDKLLFTDFELLKTIQKEYYIKYMENMKESNKDKNKTLFYIPIDCYHIASKMNADPEVIFNRLNFNLNHKYEYEKEGKKVLFFAWVIADVMHCINYPYLCAILAEEQEKRKKDSITFIISIIAIIISILSYISSLS